MTLTTFGGQPVVKPFSWSYSKLDSYRTCPKKFYHAQVKKDVPEGQNDEMKWGNRVHSALANRIMHSSPLPDGMQQWEKWIPWVMTNHDPFSTVLRCEQKLAMTNQMQPCEYFDKRVPVWFRSVADVLKVRANVARLIDWKTGKVKENSEQILLTAAALMAHYPQVDHVLCQFVWLKDDLKQEEWIKRSDLPRIWTGVLPDLAALHKAHQTGEYPPKPSGLCKRHCGVISCAYHGRGAY